MSKKALWAMLGLALAAVMVFPAVAAAAENGTARVRAIVSFRESTAGSSEEIIKKFDGNKHRELPIIGGVVAEFPESKLRALAADPRVRAVELDLPVSAFDVEGSSAEDRKITRRQPVEVLPSGVDRIDAENLANNGSGIKVAVIDTGIDYRHPDLSASYQGGWDFVNGDADPEDDNGHGTHVAGIIAAQDNDFGVVGVAPGVSLYAVKVLDRSANGFISDIIAGLGWAVANGMDVANLSLGAPGASDALHDAVIAATAAGVTLVVAAGNNGVDASGYVPAAYPEVITVSAIADFDGQPGGLAGAETERIRGMVIVQSDDSLAFFSNRGSAIAVAAPGVRIYSTWVKGAYRTLSGTSMAAPHVAGAAALYIKSQRDLNIATTPDGVKAAVQSAGWHEGDAGYFGGDPDGNAEPLAKAESL